MRTRFCNHLRATLWGLVMAVAVVPCASAVSTFQLESEGLTIYFSSVELGSRNEIIEQKAVTPEGKEVDQKIPGRLVWDNLVLTRSAGADRALWEWRAQVEGGDVAGATQDFSIVAYDQLGGEVARWKFIAGWPASLSFDINEAGEAVENLVIAFERFTRAQFNVPANQSPLINLPASFSMAVGNTAQFSVITSDPDNDLVILTNSLSPVGATFVDGLFTWIAPSTAIESSETVTFQADDQQNETNSVVTESLTITIPRDFDLDKMDDDWELFWFGSISNTGDNDSDGDLASNANEFGASTSPIDPASRFLITAIHQESEQVYITFTTEPGMEYQLRVNDQPGGLGWTTLGPAWTEDSPISTTKTLMDEEPSSGTSRFYQILVRRP